MCIEAPAIPSDSREKEFVPDITGGDIAKRIEGGSG